MVNYRKMYAILCGAVSDALDVLPEIAWCDRSREMLLKALEETEEMYIRDCDEEES